MQLGGAFALSLLLAACDENKNAALENRQRADSAPAASQAGEVHSATGEVTAVAGDQVTITHGPVEGFGWPAMTMTFRAGSPQMAQRVSVGDRISFAFKQDAGAYVLTSLSKDG